MIHACLSIVEPVRFQRRFFPQLTHLGEESRQRAHMLIAVVLTLGPAGMLFTLGYLLMGEVPHATVVGLADVAAYGTLLVLHRRGVFWGAQWLIGVMFVALMGFGAYNGVTGAGPAWMGMLPLLAILLCGSISGLLWGCATLVGFVGLLVARSAGVVPLQGLPADATLFLDASGFVLFFCACVGIGLSYERIKHDAMEQLADARDTADLASAAKSTFLATMSHEIRTPMNGIIGLATLLEQTNLDRDQQELVDTLQSSSRALVDLISDILDFSKIEAGRLELERLPVAPVELVNAVVALFQPAAERKGLSLSGAVDGDVPPWLWGDPTRLRQVLANLVSNAVKFTATGEIHIHARTNGAGQWRVEVRDTGPGVPQPRQQVLFEAFVQAESSTTRRHGGTGLGLAICKQLVGAMAGEIGVLSDGHQGSCFWIALPAAVVPPAARPAPQRVQPPVRFDGSVLLVEDNPINQLVASRMLARLGLSVTVASDGQDALDVLAQAAAPFQLVLMDLSMPRMDGYTAAREARRRGVATPIVALTADVTTDARAATRAAGMDDYLSKPILLEKLVAVLSGYLTATPCPDTPNVPGHLAVGGAVERKPGLHGSQ